MISKSITAFCMSILMIISGCSSVKMVPSPILKEHRIKLATEELDEWLHNHCSYIGVIEGKVKAHSWANDSKVNFLEILEGNMPEKEVMAGFHCDTFPSD